MYASQWFLTLFTAKFPLQMVFFIVDLFLSTGMVTIFHISLALLQDSKKDLLQLDFEGMLKYFRVTLPRRYRTMTNAKELIHNAVKLKVSHKRLSKYEKDYYAQKQRELESLDPLERLERENFRLKETILRLERENDDLAHELVTSKIELRNRLDLTEDQLETTTATVERKSRECHELQEQNRTLKDEVVQVKTMCRTEVSRLDEEVKRAHKIIEQYKKICSDLGNTFEADKAAFEEQKRVVVARVSDCENCSPAIAEWIAESPRGRRQLLAAQNGDEHPTEEKQLNGNANAGVFQIMDLMNRLQEREEHVSQVELELAQTKLALVEAQCQNQDLAHQMSTSMSALTDSGDNRPAWLKKTISSIREVGTSLKNSQQNIGGGPTMDNNGPVGHLRNGHTRSNSNVSMASTNEPNNK